MRSFVLRTALLGLAVAGIGLTYNFALKPVVIVEEEAEEIETPKARKREPASVRKPSPIAPLIIPVSSSQKDESNFNQTPDLPDSTSEAPALAESPSQNNGDQGSSGFGPSGGESSNGSSNGASRDPASGSKTASTQSGPKSVGGGAVGGIGVGAGGGITGGTSGGSTTGGSSGGVIDNDDLTCTANIGGGSFGNPIAVNLDCTAAADIKYCLKQGGSCCDPEVSGVAYSVPVVIGAEDGDYCLSFYGESVSNKISSVSQKTYTFNNTYPDLQISYPQIFYQTTELAGLHFLTSNDFSKSNFEIGEINLKANDPGPGGLNIGCQEIVETYASLPAPTPAFLFNPLDMAGIAFGDQLNVPMLLDKLTYGDNFLSSFVVNNNFAAPLYSCSTNKVVLRDFDYFVFEASHGVAGTNVGREFSGSFVSYSFFEAQTDLNRTPAGVAIKDDSGQELQVGSFGVFY